MKWLTVHGRRRFRPSGYAAAVALVLVGGLAASYVAAALATPASGVTQTIIGVGRFQDIDVKTKTDIDPGKATDYWQSRIDTKGASDLHILQNTVAPGGTFGWHGHPGPSLIIVKSGTATYYMADDPTCTPHVIQAGSGFVDEGSGHLVRNEGSVDLVTVVASLVPAGFTRRIDKPAPPNCLPNG
jgi:quercetin dioxygenase-like cupin family protein